MYEHMNIFTIQHRRNYNTRNDYVTIGFAPTVAAAKKLRVVTGDLVVDMRSGEVVKNRIWLWDFERQNPKSYAQRAIADAISR